MTWFSPYLKTTYFRPYLIRSSSIFPDSFSSYMNISASCAMAGESEEQASA